MRHLGPDELLDEEADSPSLPRRTVLMAIGLAGLTGRGQALVDRTNHLSTRGHDSRSFESQTGQPSDGEWSPEAKLTASDATAAQAFGTSVALDGDRALIGAQWDSENALAGGAAYIFEFDDGTGTWNQVQKLTASDVGRDDNFGASVSLDGRHALVGAPEKSGVVDLGGAAYLFSQREDGDWPATEDWKLTASGTGQGQFGRSVALDGSRAFVGAPGALEDGAMYVFEQRGDGNWPTTEDYRFTTSDPKADRFGYQVAVDGQIAFVSGRDLSGEGVGDFEGVVYVFSRRGDGTWEEDDKLTARGADANSGFGQSVAIDGVSSVVGAPFESGRAEKAGAAYAFGPEWSEKMTAPDAGANDRFGWSVALDGTRTLVGAPDNIEAADDTGGAYLFDVTTRPPTELQRFTAPDAEPGDGFGGRLLSTESERSSVLWATTSTGDSRAQCTCSRRLRSKRARPHRPRKPPRRQRHRPALL